MTMARAKSSILTDKQHAYAEAVLDGKTKVQAVKEAGYAPSCNASTIEKSRDLTQYIEDRRGELIEITQIKRADVAFMLKEAYDMAKQMSEPSTMVSAAKEIGRMFGFYEPDSIKVELSMSQSNLKSKLAVLSDAELLQLVSGNATVVNGEFVEVADVS